MRAVDKVRLVKNLGLLNDNTRLKLCASLQELFAF